MGDKDQGGSKRLREKKNDGDDEAEQSSSSSKRQRPSEERESGPSQLQPPFAPIDFDSVINSVIASELAAWNEKNKRICPVCDATFKRGVLHHLLTHSEERPYSCELCSEKFRRNDALEHHFRTWHEKSTGEAKDLVEAAEHKYLKENPNFSTNENLQVNGLSRLHADIRDTALRKQNMYPFYDPRVIENLVSMHFNYIRSREQRQEPHGPQQVENPNQIPNSAQKFGHDITQENSQMILYGHVPYSCSASSISSVSRSDRENESEISEEADINELENTIRQNLAEYRNDIEFGPELPVSPVPFNEEQSNLSVIMETQEIVNNRDTPELAQVDLNTMDGRSEIIEEENDILPIDIGVTDDESNVLQTEEEQEVQSKNESFEVENLQGLIDAIPGPSHASSDATSQEEMIKSNSSFAALKDNGPDVIVGDLESATSAADTGETIENMQVNNGNGDDHDDSNELHTPAQYYDTQENVEVRGNLKTVIYGDHDHDQQHESDGGEETSSQPRANSTTSSQNREQGGSKRLREKVQDEDGEDEQNSSSNKRQRPSEERESGSSQLQPPFAPIDFGSVINSVIASNLTPWKENKRVCPICYTTFPRGLLEHLLTHSERRPYSCELCSDKFRRHDALEQHFRTRHEKSAGEAKDLVEKAEHKYLKENPNFSTNANLHVNCRSRLHANMRDTTLRRETMCPFYDPRVIENLVSMHFNYIRSREQRQEPHGPQQMENSNQIPNSAGKFGHDITQENSQMILYGHVPYSCSASSISSVSRSDRQNESDISEEEDINELENTIRQNLAEYRNDIEFGPELPVSPVPSNEEQSQLSNLSVMMETEEIVSNRDTSELAQVDLNTMDGRAEIIEEENDIVPMDMDVTDDELNALQREEEQEVQSKNESFKFEDLQGLTDAIPGPSHASSDVISQEEVIKSNPSVPALKVNGPDAIVGDLESATSSADNTGETIENVQINNGNGDDPDGSNALHIPAQYYDTQENVEVRGNVITVLESDHDQQHESDGGEEASAQPRATSSTSQDGEQGIPLRHGQLIPEQKNPKKNNPKLVPNQSKMLAANSKKIRCRPYSSEGTTKHVQSQKQKGSEQRELNVKMDKDRPGVAINLQQRSVKIRPRVMSPDMNGYLHFHRHTRAPPQSYGLKELETEIRNGEWEESVIPIRGVFVQAQAIVLLIWLFLVIFWSIFL